MDRGFIAFETIMDSNNRDIAYAKSEGRAGNSAVDRERPNWTQFAVGLPACLRDLEVILDFRGGERCGKKKSGIVRRKKFFITEVRGRWDIPEHDGTGKMDGRSHGVGCVTIGSGEGPLAAHQMRKAWWRTSLQPGGPGSGKSEAGRGAIISLERTGTTANSESGANSGRSTLSDTAFPTSARSGSPARQSGQDWPPGQL